MCRRNCIDAGTTFATGAITTNNFSSTNLDANIPTCQVNSVNNIWYSVVVPASGNITVESGSVAGSTFTDSVIVAYSGICGALTELACSDDIETPASLFSKIELTGQTPGATIYFSVWRYSFMGGGLDGQFQMSAYDATLANDTFDITNFAYYPNPVKGILNLTSKSKISNVTVFNFLGQQVMVSSINATEAHVDMSELANGPYFVRVMADNNQMKTFKVIKQ